MAHVDSIPISTFWISGSTSQYLEGYVSGDFKLVTNYSSNDIVGNKVYFDFKEKYARHQTNGWGFFASIKTTDGGVTLDNSMYFNTIDQVYCFNGKSCRLGC